MGQLFEMHSQKLRGFISCQVVLCNKNLMKILTMSGRIPDIEEELKKIQQQKQEYITYDDLSENEVIIFSI